MAQVIARTRDKAKAERTAKALAGASQRTIGVRPYDARTWEVFTQADMDVKTINALQAMSLAFNKLEQN